MNDARTALDEVDRQRSALAERVRLPLWYRVLWAFALLALFAVPLLQPHASVLALFLGVQLPGIVVLSVSGLVLHRSSGACLARNVMRAYPSCRRPMLGMIAVIVVGSLVATGLAIFVSPMAATLIGIVAVTGAVTCFDRYLAGIRSDIRAGRVVGA